MRLRITLVSMAVLVVLGACSPDSPVSTTHDTSKSPYYVLDDQLTQLKADFNAMTDKVRLVFISGPSCGFCLRGLDDLNESIVASIQDDPRIHTIVIHVPTLDAEEKHAAAAIPLMQGPRVTHFWDPSGHSGLDFQKALAIPFYAWDVWMIYEPGARWEQDQPPPAPKYWEHQLGPLSKENALDSSRFAAAVRERLAVLPPATEEARVAAFQRQDSTIMRVAQPRSVMIQQNHQSRGGYQNLKTISSIHYDGETEADGKTYSLTVETERPHHYKRIVNDGARSSKVVWDGAKVVREGPPLGLPTAVQDELLASYEFDGWMTDWKEKGHQVWRLGMKKHGDRLPWIMEAELTNGRTWHIYVDSHTGDAYRQVLMGSDDKERLALEFGDYRDIDGFRLPHEVRYFNGGRLLATDRFRQINIETTPSARALADGLAEDSA